ncbi:MAG: glycosyltransferase family 4 protein [Acidobacteria bacterium]|nr:glycosyltransferase family 4 protein [Acidobacteriota bacterium]
MRRITLGIIANELFSSEAGRMGGFGWALSKVSECFCADPSLGVDPVILMGQRLRNGTPRVDSVHGSRVVWLEDSFWRWGREIRRQQIDLLLSIDYRSNYRAFFALLPRTPVLLWVRDPWDFKDREIIGSLRIPGENAPPQGVKPHATRTLAPLLLTSRLMRRRIQLAVTTPWLAPKIPDSYGVPAAGVAELPNIILPHGGKPRKAERPVVAFLARLDPYKRPWIVVELARRMPDVEFVMMGQGHFSGPGSWQITDPPPNLRLLGHVGEDVKRPELERAWILVNTSIHEGLAVSFLEALAQETPVVSTVDPDKVVTRFGRALERFPGDGMDGAGTLIAALRSLIDDTAERQALGSKGRAWVESTHSRETFLRAFFQLASRLEVNTG